MLMASRADTRAMRSKRRCQGLPKVAEGCRATLPILPRQAALRVSLIDISSEAIVALMFSLRTVRLRANTE